MADVSPYHPMWVYVGDRAMYFALGPREEVIFVKIITVNEKTPQGRALLAQMTRVKRKTMNPFPFSLLEHFCSALLDGIESVARLLASVITAYLPQRGKTRRRP